MTQSAGFAAAASPGALWALLTVVICAAVDGTASSEYEMGNRFALGFMFLLLMVVLPSVQLVAYVIGLLFRLAPGRSAALAQVPGLVTCFVIIWQWRH